MDRNLTKSDCIWGVVVAVEVMVVEVAVEGVVVANLECSLATTAIIRCARR